MCRDDPQYQARYWMAASQVQICSTIYELSIYKHQPCVCYVEDYVSAQLQRLSAQSLTSLPWAAVLIVLLLLIMLLNWHAPSPSRCASSKFQAQSQGFGQVGNSDQCAKRSCVASKLHA